jgi:YidC/Oxa1 family membrane protein insertase
LPLSFQQSKGTEYTKALKPYQDEIKEKFKDNKDMQNKAVAKLFEDASVNPLNGCLLSLAQFPIFIGLYRSVTLLAQEGKLSEPFLWIPSLGGPVSPPTYRGMEWITSAWTSFDGVPTPQLGWEATIAFLIMPVVLVLGQAFTMQVMTPPVDENASAEEKETLEKSQRILKFLPLMIGYFSLQVPAGLTIYWFVSNLFTTSQSLAIRAYYKLNPPNIELPDYWDALDDVSNMSPEEQRKAAEAGLRAGPKFEDLIEEARYHAVIERAPLRIGSSAWNTVGSSGGSVPAEFQDWVACVEGGPAVVTPVVPHFATAVSESEESGSKKQAANVQ